MEDVLHLQLFGNLRLSWGPGAAIAIQSPRLETLLAYLVLHRTGPQPRAYLAFILWPDSSEAQALSNLRNLLTRLRQLTPGMDRYIESSRTDVSWRSDAPLRLDVLEFEALARKPLTPDTIARALDLYTADLLPAHYEEWLEPIRRRLRETFERLLDDALPHLEAVRDYPLAIRCAKRRLELDPLHEATWGRLMELHAVTGNRGAVLQAWKACVDIFERELEAPPGAALTELYKRLSKQEPPAPPRPPPAPAPEVPPFVGRTAEWSRLLALWQEAAAGHPRAALLAGEAGVGKTRLLEELMAQVRGQGHSVAFARCYGSEGHLAFAPVTMLIRSCPPAQLAPVWRSELARLLPELDGTGHGQPHTEHEREPWRRQRLFEALARALYASLPLLLVVDDLQWCDQDSLEWLHFLMRFDNTARLLVVATVRSEDLLEERPLSRVVETLRYEQLLETLPVPPLSGPDAASLARSLVEGPLSPDAAHRLYDESEGNPLYIIELVRAGMLTRPSTEQLPLPARMEAVLSARFAPLPADARALAELAATRAGTVTPTLLAVVGGLEPAVVAELLDGLEVRGIMRESNGHYDFTHGKLRQFAYDRIRSARKRVLHLQWARALEAEQAGRPGGPSGEVAHHYELAGELERAASAYVTAGDEARQVYALHDAIRHYTAALRCLPDDRGLEVRWQALSGREQVHDMMGSTEARTADLSKMETLAVRERDDRWRATVYVRQSQLAYAQGRLETALERAGAARSLAAATGDTRLEALACFCRANALYELDASGLVPAVEALSRGAALARQAGDAPLECWVQSYLAIGYARIGRCEEALLCADEALALARTLKDPRREALCQTSRGLSLKRLRRFRDARLAHEAAVQLARELALPADLAVYQGHLGLACYRLGDFEQAIVHLTAAAGTCVELNQRANAAGWFSHLGALYGVIGDERQAYHHLEQARSLAQGAAHAWIEGLIVCRHATLLAEFGHPGQALELITRDQACGQRAEHPMVGASRLYARGLACALLERWEEASELLKRAERALAETTEGDGSLITRPASVLLAEVQLRQGDLEGARRRLQPFVAEIDAGIEGDVVPERTLYVYSQLLRALGDPAGAVARLKQAEQLVLEVAGRLTPEHRAAYLHQVPTRRALLEALAREVSNPGRGRPSGFSA